MARGSACGRTTIPKIPVCGGNRCATWWRKAIATNTSKTNDFRAVDCLRQKTLCQGKNYTRQYGLHEGHPFKDNHFDFQFLNAQIKLTNA